MLGTDSKPRVFVSYSREDRPIVEVLVGILEEHGLHPLWDRDFIYGIGFPDQVRAFIAHSQLFIPLITEKSSARGWVHQEIGYGMAMKVPMLPICIGRVPGEMLSQLQALTIEGGLNLSQIGDTLRRVITRTVVSRLLFKAAPQTVPPFECAQFPEQRALMMVEYASQVTEFFEPSLLRQIGGLSSMHIPADDITASVWDERYGSLERGDFHRMCQRNERFALEYHAREAGYRLIVEPDIRFNPYGPRARIVRLECLLAFLKSTENVPIANIAFKRHHEDEDSQTASDVELRPRQYISPIRSRGRSVTCVGDWFLAESISGTVGKGYYQTIFTRHPTYVRTQIQQFDDTFHRLLRESGWTPENSRVHAINELTRLLADLKSEYEHLQQQKATREPT